MQVEDDNQEFVGNYQTEEGAQAEAANYGAEPSRQEAGNPSNLEDGEVGQPSQNNE